MFSLHTRLGCLLQLLLATLEITRTSETSRQQQRDRKCFKMFHPKVRNHGEAPSRAFSWLKAATTAFTFKTLLRHCAKRALNHGN